MLGDETRPSIRFLVFGPITRSVSFWAMIGLIIIAAGDLGYIWLRIRQSPADSPVTPGIFVFLVIMLASSCYIYFADLAKLKAQALAETDLAKCGMICQRADFRLRVFCGVIGIFIVALMVWI
jgi:hypothetical protein